MQGWEITQDRTPGSGFCWRWTKSLGAGEQELRCLPLLTKYYFPSPTNFIDIFFKLPDVLSIGCRDEAATMYNY